MNCGERVHQNKKIKMGKGSLAIISHTIRDSKNYLFCFIIKVFGKGFIKKRKEKGGKVL